MEKISWNTEKRKISQLKGYSKNPRKISKDQFQQLVASIKKFDYVELVAIDNDNTIIAGHMRVKAIKKIYGKSYEIEVRVSSRKLSENEFEEYLIRSNLNTGSFDYDILANEYDALDLLQWGFSEEQLIGCFEEKPEKEKKTAAAKTTCPNCGHEFEGK